MKVRTLTEEYLDIIRKDREKAEKNYDRAIDFIHHSTAIYHGEYIRFPYVPKLYTDEIIGYYRYIVKTTHSILSKIIKRYLEDADYRKLFGFEKELEELILADAGYDDLLPIARFDLFLNEDDLSFKFCEFNADGASAMNEDRELNNAFREDETFKNFQKTHEVSSFELFDSWIDTVEEIYKGFRYRKENPTVAIVDFMESATSEEFKIFRKRFEDRGYRALISDITKLSEKDGILFDESGERIDIVYRRAVTSELMEKRDRADAFIKAVRAGKTCIIGSLKTQVIHNKIVFMIMHMDETLKMLDDEERDFVKNHVPLTKKLESGSFSLDEIAENKDRWIIKPDDLYGARGVYAGVDYTKEEYRKLVSENTDRGYLLQEYAPMYKTDSFIKETDGSFRFDSFSNMPGLFSYNGKFAGIYARGGRQGLICEAAGGIAFCSMHVHE